MRLYKYSMVRQDLVTNDYCITKGHLQPPYYLHEQNTVIINVFDIIVILNFFLCGWYILYIQYDIYIIVIQSNLKKGVIDVGRTCMHAYTHAHLHTHTRELPHKITLNRHHTELAGSALGSSGWHASFRMISTATVAVRRCHATTIVKMQRCHTTATVAVQCCHSNTSVMFFTYINHIRQGMNSMGEKCQFWNILKFGFSQSICQGIV